MRKKLFTLLLLLACIIPFTLGARSLVNVSLGAGATYFPPEEEEFFGPAITEANNWRFHGELSARLSILQAQALVFPVECNSGRQGVLMVGMGSLSLPVFGSFFSLELGGGVGMTYIPTSSASADSYYIVAGDRKVGAKGTSFQSALWQSPLYLQGALASELGPIGIRIRYLVSTKASLQQVIENKEWWSIFNMDSGALSLVLSLRMF